MSDGNPPPRRLFALILVALPFLFLGLLELALRVAGLRPPENPLVFYAKTYAPDYSPFIETEGGALEIRPEWVNDGNTVRVTEGTQAGHYFMEPGFRPARVTREKAPGTIRIFALGGSTTFGLYVGPEQTFAEILGRRIEAETGRPVEMINLGCGGWASNRVANILDAALSLDPDLVVVLSGHNEMLRTQSEDGPDLGPLWRARQVALERSLVAAWLDHAVTTASRAGRTEAVTEGSAEEVLLARRRLPFYEPRDLAVDQRWLPDRAYIDRAVAGYRANIERMVAAGDAADVPILFVLPVSNLLEPPGISQPAPDPASQAELDTTIEAARAALAGADYAAAVAQLDRAVALSPTANALYGRGIARLGVGDRGAALDDLQRACDLDLRTTRITSSLETAMIDAVESAGGTWLDLRPGVRHYQTHKVMGDRSFFSDHCHPTAFGHSRLGAWMAPRALELLAAATDADP